MNKRQYFSPFQRPANDKPDQYRSILLDFITNALNHHLLADSIITGNILYRYIGAFWCSLNPKEDYESFNAVARVATEFTHQCECSWRTRNPEQESNLRHNPDAYFESRLKDVPEIEPHNRINQFIEEYVELDRNVRTVIDAARYGLLFIAVNDPNFTTLCKNKDIDTSSMTFEQKMDEELDHEALYRYLQDKLGTA